MSSSTIANANACLHIRLGEAGSYRNPLLNARLNHPGLAYQKSQSGNGSASGDAGLGYRRLGETISVDGSEFTCFGVG